MDNQTSNTPAMDTGLYSRMLNVLQNYSITPGVMEIALVNGIKWHTVPGWKMAGPTTCSVLIYNPRTDENFWIEEPHFASEDEKIMLRTAAIGDIIAYTHNGSDIVIIKNFDMERRMAAAKQAFIDFSKPSK